MPIETAYPSNPNGAVVLGQSGAAVSHTGDTTETVLATIAVPANLLGKNGRVDIRATFSKTGTAGACLCKGYFGLSGAGITGTLIASNNIGATTLTMVGLAAFANDNAANAQSFLPAQNWVLPYNTSTSAIGSSAVDTSQACEIAISGKLANSGDTIALVSYQVLAYPHA